MYGHLARPTCPGYCILFLLVMAADGSTAGEPGACPGSGGDCCIDNGTPGCDDVDCCEAVCAIDPFCCDVSWDQICADEAGNNPLICGCGADIVCGPPDAGDCCSANGTPGCTDVDCCEAVCAVNFDCCFGPWNSACADVASRVCDRLCGANCKGTILSADPPSGTVDARQPHELGDPLALQGIGGVEEPIFIDLGEAGATIDCFALCETAENELTEPNSIASVTDHGDGTYTVLLEKPIAANAATRIVYADESAIEYISHPANVNADSTASASDVLWIVDVVNGLAVPQHGRYSSDIDHSGIVATPDILRTIDLLNGADALPTQLGTLLPQVEPCDSDTVPSCLAGTGNCCEPNGTPSCDDVACCDDVCSADPFCCDFLWDDHCATLASFDCPSLCGDFEGCGRSSDDCCSVHDDQGCGDETCCVAVCTQDPFCCEESWDFTCVSEAADLCGCANVMCPSDATGNCCQEHETPGCDDTECCETVCMASPFCCDITWSSSCVEKANELCGDVCSGCGNSHGDCCFPSSTPSCDDPECCAAVCSIDPFCCDTLWDTVCADEAAELCDCPGTHFIAHQCDVPRGWIWGSICPAEPQPCGDGVTPTNECDITADKFELSVDECVSPTVFVYVKGYDGPVDLEITMYTHNVLQLPDIGLPGEPIPGTSRCISMEGNAQLEVHEFHFPEVILPKTFWIAYQDASQLAGPSFADETPSIGANDGYIVTYTADKGWTFVHIDCFFFPCSVFNLTVFCAVP